MDSIANQCVAELVPASEISDLEANFSKIVSDVQDLAYDRYLGHERAACSVAIRGALEAELDATSSAADVVDLVCANTFTFDRVFLSMAQSRKARAGSTYERVINHLLDAAGYPYEAQPDLKESRPDYVLPSLAHYEQHASDCVLLTCKRTLRERWRQIVTEGTAGQFFLATIDSKLSGAELDRMKDRRVIVIVPAPIKSKRYESALNVISFEAFLEHYLDPAVTRWKSAGVI